MKKKLWIAGIMLTGILTACSGENAKSDNAEDNITAAPTLTQSAEQPDSETGDGTQTTDNTAVTGLISYSGYDLDAAAGENAAEITLDGQSVQITEAGTYILTGTLENGQITIEVADDEKVHLIFKGVNITCTDASALCILNADKVVLTLAEGTENFLTDGSSYAVDDNTACIYSKDDLTINGTGSLTVTGNYNNGIVCTNDLKLVSGIINVTAPDNGMKGKDSLSILDAVITISGCEDGVKCDNDTEENQGCFTMEGGSLSITASDDGISAVTSVEVTGGSIVTKVGDKAVNCDGVTRIAEGCLTEK